MRILVLTSCTGEKAVDHPRRLTLADFQHGREHVRRREHELGDLLRPAEQLYTGQQHVRLLRGVRQLRQAVNEPGTLRLDLYIVSAGYGLVPADQPLAPYEATFQGMPRAEVRRWAEELGLPHAVGTLLGQPFDLGIVLLGDAYLDACGLSNDLALGGPTLVLCGAGAVRRLPRIASLRPVVLKEEHTRRFGAGLVALKGEVAARILGAIAHDRAFVDRVVAPCVPVLELIDDGRSRHQHRPPIVVPNPVADRVVEIPVTWWEQSRQRQLRYFIPDWDDRVDPDFDFAEERHSGGRPSWSNEVYAHQLYDTPNYDGILVSRTVIEKPASKLQAIEAAGGMHRYLRVPSEFPILGDCGAFNYVERDVPPYTTAGIIDYYTRVGVDLGVSIDHLIFTRDPVERRRRYELTIQNAEDFIREHRARGLHWEPVGAIQGWDENTYAAAARAYAAMGYSYIAVGGLVRRGDRDLLGIVEAVRAKIPSDMRMHLFGIGRFHLATSLVELGVTSMDSASHLRRAWLRSDQNLFTTRGWYSALRIPFADPQRSLRARRLITSGACTEERLVRLEQNCLEGVRRYAGRCIPLTESLVDTLTEYDGLIHTGRSSTADDRTRLSATRRRIRRTLEDRPWEACTCAICRACGVEIAIFRGNNRNRRRGFHNVYVFYDLLGRVLDGESVPWPDCGNASGTSSQLALFPA